MNTRTNIMHLVKIVASLGLLASTLGAHANTEQYLVKFKTPGTFAMISRQIKAQPFVGPRGTTQSMQLLNTDAAVTEALDHVQLLIVESSDEATIETLRRHPAVAMVEKEIIHPLPEPMATWSRKPMQAGDMKSKGRVKMNRPWGIDAVRAPAAWSVTEGQSARVMVLDTGIDKTHPAVKDRLEKAQNFTGGSSLDVTDAVGHGTHVSGTILASGQDGGLVGVAPKARLLMGKVCSNVGCSSAAIARGINWAVSEHVDVVNMSLGGSMISEGEMQAIRAAEAAGVFIAAASGNSGVAKVSFPAAVESITAVGAVDSALTKADFSQWGPELDVVGPGVDVLSSVPQGTGRGANVQVDIGKGLNNVLSVPFVGSPVRSIHGEFVFVGMGKTTDLANVDLTGKIALIVRGEIPFKEKVENVAAKGAVAAVVFNNAPGLIQPALTEDGSEGALVAVMIEQALGEEIKAVVASGVGAQASVVVEATDYAPFQGTSMATPHVAGVAALVRAANHNLTPVQVREILKETATALGPNGNNEYGAGLVNAEAAVHKAIMTNALVLQVAN